MQDSHLKNSRIDLHLAGLFVLLVAINLPSFFLYVMPHHDTFGSFQNLYFFYNEYFFHGELPQWMPFGFYGIQSSFDLISNLSPAVTLSGLIGIVFGIEDVFFIFNLAMFFEQSILLVGTYLLSRALFVHRTTATVVTAIVITSTVLHFQIFLNLKPYLYLPLIFYFMVRFFSEARFYFLFSSIAVFAVSFLGFAVYLIPLQLLPIVVVAIVLIITHAGEWRRFTTPKRYDLIASGALLTFSLITVAIYYNYISHAMDHTEVFSTGRDPETLATTLDTFLYYASEALGFKKFTGLLYPTRSFVVGDVTVHCGLLALVFSLYALVFVRRALLWGFFVIALVFALLSLGDATPVAEALYHYFPMMKYYRHIGQTVGNFKLFIPLMAGFGIDHLLCQIYKVRRDQGTTEGHVASRSAFILKLISGAAFIVGASIYVWILTPGYLPVTIVASILLAAALFYIGRRIDLMAGSSLFIIATVAVSGILFQTLPTKFFHRMTEDTRPHTERPGSVNHYDFALVRSLGPSGARSTEAKAMTDSATVKYALAYNFIQWDPCIARYRTDFANPGVVKLLTARGGGVRRSKELTLGGRLVLPKDRALLKSMGCMSPKIKLFKNVVYTDTTGEAEALIKKTPDIDKLLVLTGLDSAPGNGGGSTTDPLAAGSTEVISYRANEITIKAKVEETAGAWLYYAESWHPNWKAFVNQRETPLALANLAFKALWLEAGESTVRLTFDNPGNRRTMNYLMIVGIAFMLALFFFIGASALGWGYPEAYLKDRPGK